MNTLCIIGNLGKDPEIRRTPSGDAVVSFSIAVSEKWNGTNGPQERTDWFDIVAWRGTAELIGQYVKKGHKVGIVGKLRQNKWEDKDGNARSKVEIHADRVDFLTPKSQDAAPAGNQQQQQPPQQQQSYQPQQQPPPQGQGGYPQQQAPAGYPSQGSGASGPPPYQGAQQEDDLPF